MRPAPAPDEPLAELARRRLALLSAEIAGGAERLSADEPVHRPPVIPGRHARRPVGRSARVVARVQDHLPATLQGRVALGATQLATVAVAIALGLAVSAWWVLRTDDLGTPIPAARPVAASPSALVTPLATESSVAPTGASAPSGSAAPSGVVVVDVSGKVRRPGIASLPVGSRVIDALRAAGGPRPGVDLTSLNRARLLVDGEQIVVGAPAPSGAAASSVGGPGADPPIGPLVNLNTADQSALEALPGVGPVTAQAIIAWRDENGGFRSVDDLLEVSGIGDATLAELAPYVTL